MLRLGIYKKRKSPHVILFGIWVVKPSKEPRNKKKKKSTTKLHRRVLYKPPMKMSFCKERTAIRGYRKVHELDSGFLLQQEIFL